LHGGKVGKIPHMHSGNIRFTRDDLKMAPNIFRLVFFRPHQVRMTVQAGEGVRAELGQDNRLMPGFPDCIQLHF
jgi:hypothetical protein